MFRQDSDASQLEARRFRRVYFPRVDHRSIFEAEHRDVISELLRFAELRGRLPTTAEISCGQQLSEEFGTAQKGLAAVRRYVDEQSWAKAEFSRTEDLVVTLALARFTRRPRLGELPSEIQADVRAFFTSYEAACRLADELLFALGNAEVIRRACRQSKVGKLTPKALYVHRDALTSLSPVLRLYEGCACAWIGSVDAEIVKLHYDSPTVSYLKYPAFDSDPHPRLQETTVLNLKHQTMGNQSYNPSGAVPILHRKERFLDPSDPRYEKFASLTRQEERAGLYDDTSRIGLSSYWDALLDQRGFALRGHRLYRRKAGNS